MTTPEQPLPAGGPRREEAALARDRTHAGVAADHPLLVAFFLTPSPLSRSRSCRRACPWRRRHRGRLVSSARVSRARSGRPRLPGREREPVEANSLRNRDHAVTELSDFERALENESLLARSLRPSAQLTLTRWFGAGNERVYPGLDRWLFYRQDVDYVIGHGFLDPAQIRRRMNAAPECDGAAAGSACRHRRGSDDDLEARGIALIVMPTPVKPGVHPEMLARRYTGTTGVLQNPSYRAISSLIWGVRV